MTPDQFLQEINELLGIILQPASIREHDPLGSLMATKTGISKYLILDEKLVGLDLSNTGLTDAQWKAITELSGFHPGDIRALKLCDNKLTTFPIPENRKALERLDLSGNRIREFTLPTGMDRLYDLNLEENPLTSVPEETQQQGKDAVLRFLKNLAAQGIRDVYEVKMLIVGEGGTGKTTLWNKLQNPDHPVPDKDQESTVGIGIKEGWEFRHLDHPDMRFLVNLWDFGGQEIQYMTHQFFLTRRSFYVLLADGRREVANFPYWFKIIDLLGCDHDQPEPLPVMVLLNEKGNPISKLPYDPGTIRKDYPKLEVIKREVDFAKKDDRLTGLPLAIQEILCRRMPHLPLRIPAYWESVRNELYRRRIEKKHIDFAEFKSICTQNGISEEDEKQMTDLSRLFHDLGVLLHYPEDFSLRDFIVLNPKWAVNAVYEVLRHDEVRENMGRFDKELLIKVWSGSGYTPFEQRNLLDLMRKDKLEVCFSARENGQEIFIAPQMLPDQRPEFMEWSPDGPLLKYSYQYPFMPKGIIGRLIVRLHEDLQTRSGKKVVWEKGMVLEKDGCQALVYETTEEDKTGLKLIQIEVGGGRTAEDRRYVLRDIRQGLEGIHRRSFQSLKYEEKIPCCCSYCTDSDDAHFFDLSILEKRQQMPKKTIECPNSGIDLKVQDLFDGVYLEKEFRNPPTSSSAGAPKKVFFSYSKEDLEFLNELKEHLSGLTRQGKIQGWDDSRILPGEEWDGAIKNELASADLILLLVSSKFLKTNYIWDVEIKAAMKRHERKEARVVPIILRPCLWENMPFGKLNGLPKKGEPVSSFSDRDAAWTEVVKGIQRVIDGLEGRKEQD